MTARIAAFAAAALALALSACITQPKGPGAPEPARIVDAERFYSGTWYEIARRPMGITDGCVAGATTYSNLDGRRVDVRDTCRQENPEGEETALRGSGWIVNPGENTKLRVRYLGVVVWEYWVLDRAEDYSWFISSNPSMGMLFIYTRDPNPSTALISELTGRAEALGYDPDLLEFPERFPD